LAAPGELFTDAPAELFTDAPAEPFTDAWPSTRCRAWRQTRIDVRRWDDDLIAVGAAGIVLAAPPDTVAGGRLTRSPVEA
jgi:hypothetical protein